LTLNQRRWSSSPPETHRVELSRLLVEMVAKGFKRLGSGPSSRLERKAPARGSLLAQTVGRVAMSHRFRLAVGIHARAPCLCERSLLRLPFRVGFPHSLTSFDLISECLPSSLGTPATLSYVLERRGFSLGPHLLNAGKEEVAVRAPDDRAGQAYSACSSLLACGSS
jgi:hypothetical protein